MEAMTMRREGARERVKRRDEQRAERRRRKVRPQEKRRPSDRMKGAFNEDFSQLSSIHVLPRERQEDEELRARESEGEVEAMQRER
jgi:hypothetical protein